MEMRREALQLGLLGAAFALFGTGRAHATDVLAIDPNGVKIRQDDWTAVTDFKNDWLNWKDNAEGYAPAGYFKDSLGIVHLRGVVQGGKVGWGSGVIFALPQGYWPEYRSVHIVMASFAPEGLFGQLEVDANGDVIAAFPDPFPTGKERAFSLDGVAFRAV